MPYTIPPVGSPGSGGHLAHSEAVRTSVLDAGDRLDALEDTNSVFFEATVGSGINLGSSGFETYPISNVVTNNGGGSFNTSTYIYTIPENGLYDCQATIRIADSQAARSLGVGIGTSNTDAAHFLWGQMGGIMRDGKQYRRVTRFNNGDQVRLYIYSDGTSFPVNAGNLAIRKVAN